MSERSSSETQEQTTTTTKKTPEQQPQHRDEQAAEAMRSSPLLMAVEVAPSPAALSLPLGAGSQLLHPQARHFSYQMQRREAPEVGVLQYDPSQASLTHPGSLATKRHRFAESDSGGEQQQEWKRTRVQGTATEGLESESSGSSASSGNNASEHELYVGSMATVEIRHHHPHQQHQHLLAASSISASLSGASSDLPRPRMTFAAAAPSQERRDAPHGGIYSHAMEAPAEHGTVAYAMPLALGQHASAPYASSHPTSAMPSLSPIESGPATKARAKGDISTRQRGKCRKSYTVQQKLGAIEMRKSGLTVSQVAVRYGVTPKMVRDWCRHEDELHDMAADTGGDGKSKRKLHPGRKPRNVQLDKLLYDKYVHETARGYHLKNKDLQKMALNLASELGETGFRASSMFLRRWKRRYNVDIRGTGPVFGEGSSSVASEGRQDAENSDVESDSEMMSPLIQVDDDDDEEEVDVDVNPHEESLEAASTTAEADVYAEHGSDSEQEESYPLYQEKRLRSLARGRRLGQQHAVHGSGVASYARPEVTFSSPIQLSASALRMAVPCEVTTHMPPGSSAIATVALSPVSPVKAFTSHHHPTITSLASRPATLPQMMSPVGSAELFRMQLKELRNRYSYAVDGIVCMHELPLLSDPSVSAHAQSPRHPITPQASHGSIPLAQASEQERHFYQRHDVAPSGAQQLLQQSRTAAASSPVAHTGGLDSTLCSVVLAACSNGHKLPTTIVSAIPGPATASTNLGHYLPSADGKVTGDNIWHLLQNVFLPSTRRSDPRRLLILPPHWAPRMSVEHRQFVAEACKSDVVYAPSSLDPFVFGAADAGAIAQEFMMQFAAASPALDMVALATGRTSPAPGHTSPSLPMRSQSGQLDVAVRQLIGTVVQSWDKCSGRHIQDAFRGCGL